VAATGLSVPTGIAVDLDGDVFIADFGANRIVEVAAGGAQSNMGAGLNNPEGVAVDLWGDLFIADEGNNRVVEIAGNGGPQTTVPAIGLFNPRGVAVDAAGDLFIADEGNNRIVELPWSASGWGAQITVPGSGLHHPFGVAVDAAGDIFIADSCDNRVVEEPWTGKTWGTQTTIPATGLSFPSGVAVDAAGDVFIADVDNSRVVKMPAGGGAQTVVAGALSYPEGVAVDTVGDVFIADTANQRAAEFQTGAVNFGLLPVGSNVWVTLAFSISSGTTLGSIGVVTTGIPAQDFVFQSNGSCTAKKYTVPANCIVSLDFKPLAPGLRRGAAAFYDNAGNVLVTVPIYGTGTGPQLVFPGGAQTPISSGLASPMGIKTDAVGDVFIADSANSRVLELTPAGVQTAVGSGFAKPSDVAIDGMGNVFIADAVNNAVYEITAAGAQTTAVSGLSAPNALAIDGTGNLYVSQPNMSSVLKVTPSGVHTAVGSGLASPSGVAVDSLANVYIADNGNGSVFEVSPAGLQTVLATGLQRPGGLAVDAADDVYVAEFGSGAVVEIQPGGNQLTLSSGLNGPWAVALDAPGNLYFTQNDASLASESANATAPSLSFPTTLAGATSLQGPTAVTLQNIGNSALQFSSVTYPLDFPEDPSGLPTDCTSSTSLAPGATCTLTIDFTPASALTAGSTLTLTEKVQVITNSLNASASKQNVMVSGIETRLNQSIAFPSISTVLAGSTVNLTATSSSGLPITFVSLTPSICTVSGVTATMLASGFCIIQATQPGNSLYPPVQVSQTIGVGHASQTIAFATVTSQIAGASVNLSATASSGLPVSLASSTPAVCTVSGTTASLIAYGFCTIQATQAGNNAWFSTTVSQTFSVAHASQTITFAPVGTQIAATTVNLSATASSGLTVALVSLTQPVCTLAGATATLIENGTCAIQASQAGNSEYSAAQSVTQSFTVGLSAQTVTFPPIPGQLAGTSVPLSASATSGLTVSFSSTSQTVCTVAGVTASMIAAGTCTLQASVAANSQYLAASASQSFQVGYATQAIAFTPVPAGQIAESTVTLSATASSSLAVTFASTTPMVCAVAGAVASLLTSGTCTIQASQPGNGFYLSASVMQSFTVAYAAQTITFPAIPAQVAATTLSLTATASSGMPVTFATLTLPVCTVAGSTVSLIAFGTCTIQASAAQNSAYLAATAAQSFPVGYAAQVINFPAISGLIAGTSVTLSATANSGLTVSLASATPTVCTMAGASASLLQAGTCTIQASVSGNSEFLPGSASQSFAVGYATQTIGFTAIPPQVAATSVNLSATATSGQSVSFASTAPLVCTVTGSTAALIASGTCAIQASAAGNNIYSPATASQSFSVGYATQTISFPAIPSQVAATTLNLTATASSGQSVAFSTSTPLVCTVAGAIASLIESGTCTIQASAPGNNVYSQASSIQSFTVGYATQTVIFPAIPAQVAATTVSLSATASSGQPVTFASSTPLVCSVSGLIASLIASGTCTLQASAAANNIFTSASASQSFTIGYATQTIAFPAISSQVAATTVNLSATANSGLAVAFSSATPLVCTVAGAVATLIASGACTVQAAAPGNSVFAPAAASQSFTVGYASQTIAFPAIPAQMAATTLNLSATASSGLPVSFASIAPTVCTVSGSSASLIAYGTCTIQASQPGNAEYSAATPASQNLGVNYASQTIAFAPVSAGQAAGTTLPLTATSSSGLAVSFASTTPSVCTVTGASASLLAYGACNLQASAAGNSEYLPASASQTFSVAYATQTVTFPAIPSEVAATTLNLAATASSGLTVSYASTTPSVCTVSATSAALIASGTCTLQALAPANSEYQAASATQSFQVSLASQSVTFAAIPTQVAGETLTLSATASSGLAVTFASTTATVCTVSGTSASLIAAGTCNLQASQPGNSEFLPAQASQSFQVGYAAQTIAFAPIAAQIAGASLTLSATASSGLPVSLVSLTPSVCAVSGVTASLTAAGTCTIQASQPGNSEYLPAASVSQSFTAAYASQTITFAPIAPQTAGASVNLTVTASSGLAVSLSSSTPLVCTVSGATASLVAAGYCTIQAAQPGTGEYSPATASQQFAVGYAGQTVTFAAIPSQTAGGTVALTATASSGLPIAFASTTPLVCTVSAASVSPIAFGTCTIQATQSGNSQFSPASASQSFSVGHALQTIAFASIASQTAAATLNLTATASSGLPVAFASTTPAVCTVSGSVASLIASGFCNIQASQPGNNEYFQVTVSQQFGVGHALQTIAFATLTPGQTAGTTVNLAPAASSGLAVSLTSSATNICTVSGEIASLVTAGTCTIQASAPGNSEYFAATSSLQFPVSLAAQTISFTPVTASQLAGTTIGLTATASSGLKVLFASTTPAVCTVSGTVASLVASGTCTLQATQAGNSQYAAAAPVSQSFPVAYATQTISFTAIAAGQVAASTLTLSATATSGLAVSFASTTPAICTVSGVVASLISSGTCTIQAAQPGNSQYSAAAAVSQTFPVAFATQTIAFATVAAGQTAATSINLSATASSGLPVGLASSTPTVCTVAGTLASLLAAGTCTIQATQPGNSEYSPAASVSQSIAVAYASQTIAFPAVATGQLAGFTVNLTATSTSGLPVGFASTTPTICTLAGSSATLLIAGTCSIQATQPGNSEYSPATPVSQSFPVGLAGQAITFAAIAAGQVAGSTLTLSATATSGLAVTFASTTPAVCTVSGAAASLIASGDCTIQASQAGNAQYAAATPVSRAFSVSWAAQTIAFPPVAAGQVAGSTLNLSATATSGLAVSFASTTPAVCTVSTTSASLVAAGTCTIQASQSGNVEYSAAATVSQSFPVTYASQTIAFATVPVGQVAGTSVTLSASATSALPVSLASSTPTVCTINGAVASLLAAGSCTIQASQPGNTEYSSAPAVSQTFPVAYASQTITFATAPAGQVAGTTLNLSASATSGLAVAFASSTPAVCTVSGSVASLLAAGTCTIQANQPGNSEYSPAPAVSQSFTVAYASQSITFAIVAASQVAGTTLTLSASATSGLAVTFSSATATVCTVSGSVASLLAAGTCTIQAIQPGNSEYSAATPVSQSFTVAYASQTITFAIVAASQVAGTTLTLSASATSGLAVTFASSTPAVCSVSGNVASLLAAGTCTIQANQPGNSEYSAATAISQSFPVAYASQTISFPTIAAGQVAGTTLNLSAIATSGLKISFASTAPAVCTASGSVATLLAAGTCTIQAIQPGNSEYSAATAVTQSFAVAFASQSIAFPGIAAGQVAGTTINLSASATSALPVSFASSTPTICTVSGSVASLLASGTCTVQASQPGNTEFSAAATVNQSFPVAYASQTISFPSVAPGQIAGTTLNLSATSTSGLAVTFASTTAAVCAVNGNAASLIAAGTCTIQASQAGNNEYSAATAVFQSFSVALASQTITFPTIAAGQVAGTTLTLSANATSALTVSFASTTPAVCTASGSLASFLTAGTCTIQAAQPGNSEYAPAPGVSQSFSVAYATQTISFPALPSGQIAGTTTSLSATSTSGLQVSFASTTPAVCTVSGAVASLLAAGTCTIQAAQTGNTEYSAAPSVIQSFPVAYASQSITFPTIAAGQVAATTVNLSAAATSGLPVSFTSTTPAVCTVSGAVASLLTAGACTIQAAQPGNGEYSAAAPVSQSFPVSLAAQTIRFTGVRAQQVAGATVTLSAAASSGLPVAFASNAPSICTVSGASASLLAAGTCAIEASAPASAVYLAASATETFPVKFASQSITFPAIPTQIAGNTLTLSATASSGLAVTYTSDAPSVCTVSGATASLIAAGTCTLQASQSGSSEYAAANSISRAFGVGHASQSIAFAAIAPGQVALTTVPLSATATSGLTVTFTSASPAVCTVSGTTASLLASGNCDIEASQPGNQVYSSAPTVTQRFFVSHVAQSIAFAAIAPGQVAMTTVSLSATATSGLAVTFTSASPAVCTVSGTTASLLASGNCDIDASQPGNQIYSGAPGVTQRFFVYHVAQSIAFAAIAPSQVALTTVSLSATATSGLTVTFTSASPAVCTVSGTTASLLSAGNCDIEASQPGNQVYSSAPTVTQRFTVSHIAQTIAFAAIPTQTAGTTLTLSASATSALAVVFTSDTPKICTVSGVKASLLAAGNCTIQAWQPGNSVYAAAVPVSQPFKVSAAAN
jgi:sugar lactone lactonase YvrE